MQKHPILGVFELKTAQKQKIQKPTPTTFFGFLNIPFFQENWSKNKGAFVS